MARKTEIDPETILEATRKVILEKGIDVKTSSIAEEAGVSEGSIFSRFKTKLELVTEALLSTLKKDWLSLLDQADDEHDYVEVLEDAIVEGLLHLRVVMPIFMAANAHFGKKLPLFELAKKKKFDTPPIKLIKKVKRYLDLLIEKERIPPCKTDLVAAMLIGPSIERVLSETFKGTKSNRSEDKKFAKEIVQYALHGILHREE